MMMLAPPFDASEIIVSQASPIELHNGAAVSSTKDMSRLKDVISIDRNR